MLQTALYVEQRVNMLQTGLCRAESQYATDRSMYRAESICYRYRRSMYRAESPYATDS